MNYYPLLRRAKAGNRLREPRVQVKGWTGVVILSRGPGQMSLVSLGASGLSSPSAVQAVTT